MNIQRQNKLVVVGILVVALLGAALFAAAFSSASRAEPESKSANPNDYAYLEGIAPAPAPVGPAETVLPDDEGAIRFIDGAVFLDSMNFAYDVEVHPEFGYATVGIIVDHDNVDMLLAELDLKADELRYVQLTEVAAANMVNLADVHASVVKYGGEDIDHEQIFYEFSIMEYVTAE